MKPKTINTLYWIFTLLFCALMIFSSWSSILVNDDAVKLIHGMLGYPVYFIPFTGWAKLLGVIVLLLPGLGRAKEWAYAGLFFDLVAAVYSGIAVSRSFDPLMLTMLAWFIPGILSYVYWHKKQKLVATKKALPENRREAVFLVLITGGRIRNERIVFWKNGKQKCRRKMLSFFVSSPASTMRLANFIFLFAPEAGNTDAQRIN